MLCLLDTNILLRLANLQDPQYAIAMNSVVTLRKQGYTLCITPQNLIEFRSGATRPADKNGLGLTSLIANQDALTFERAFHFLSDHSDIYPTWKQLVTQAVVISKQVHDARLVAVCHVYGVSHLLTFNTKDFLRFAQIRPGLVITSPSSI